MAVSGAEAHWEASGGGMRVLCGCEEHFSVFPGGVCSWLGVQLLVVFGHGTVILGVQDSARLGKTG